MLHRFYCLVVLSLFASESVFAQDLFDQNIQYNIIVDTEDDSTIQVSYEVLFTDKKNRDKKFFETTAQDSFLMILMQDIAQQDQKKNKILFYIHGMWGGRRMNFNHAYDLMSEAYLDHRESDLARILSLKWPGNKMDYKKNKRTLYQTSSQISDLMFSLLRKIQAIDFLDDSYSTGIDMIAHSLGNELFSEMLLDLEYENTYYPFFDQIIMAASDNEVDIFESASFAKKLLRIGQATHVYFSTRDLTLGVSKNLNKRSRIGLSGPQNYDSIPEAITFIEVTEIMDDNNFSDKMTGHSYYRSSPSVTEDMLFTMINKSKKNRKVSEDYPNLYYIITN